MENRTDGGINVAVLYSAGEPGAAYREKFLAFLKSRYSDDISME
jgi:hypothetical protein